MQIRTLSGLALGLIVLVSGCQQDAHRQHHHPPSEHVQNGDQDILPGGVKAAFHRQFSEATIRDVEKQVHPDGAVHWEIRYRMKDGRPGVAEFDPDGKLVTSK